MRIGILLADTMNPDLAAIDGGYPAMYRWVFTAPDAELEVFAAHEGDLPADVTGVDAWVIGGSRASAYDDEPWIHELRSFVRRAYLADVTLVGICFGHQLIADVLGGKAGPADAGWNTGAVTYTRNDGSTFKLLASHRDQVLELPVGAEVTLSSEMCPVAGFRMGTQVITVQCHPEFSNELGAALYDGRRHLLGDAMVERAMASCRAETLARREVADDLLAFVRARTHASMWEHCRFLQRPA